MYRQPPSASPRSRHATSRSQRGAPGLHHHEGDTMAKGIFFHAFPECGEETKAQVTRPDHLIQSLRLAGPVRL
ncbi:hypothetical protein E2C01_067417 [Portunus trituberculatus]|uniref:Uncharacterized protein n=1 Tax=Portunus trituberculatus TaxID=210409 RepID=A0A5B7HKY0_PORTR|nr:hypothetical protein [Portunus trituberculatus]